VLVSGWVPRPDHPPTHHPLGSPASAGYGKAQGHPAIRGSTGSQPAVLRTVCGYPRN